MPAPVKISAEAVAAAAVELLRSGSPLNARSLASALGCSTQPIFKNFASMEAVRAAALNEIHARYLAFQRDYAAGSPEPSYKASGLAYVAFAAAEPNWFRLLFMRDRSASHGPEDGDWAAIVDGVAAYTGLPREEAELFHLEMWAFVHGLAVMRATNYLSFDEATLSRMLTDAFRGIRKRWEENHERD